MFNTKIPQVEQRQQARRASSARTQGELIADMQRRFDARRAADAIALANAKNEKAMSTINATDQHRYVDVTCGYCDRPLVDLGDRTEVCGCL